MIHQTFSSYFWITALLAALFVNVKCAERKVAEGNCQCGAQPRNGREVIYTWAVFVHIADNASDIKTCAGTVIASNVIGAPLKCLLPPNTTRDNSFDASQITVTENANGEGMTFPVLQILRKASRSRIVGIIVDYNFTDRNSVRKPVCIPEECEFKPSGLLGLPVIYGNQVIVNFRSSPVRRADDCDKTGMRGKGNGNLFCVTLQGNNITGEVGQPVYVRVSKNPHGYGLDTYVYLAGISTYVLEAGFQKHVFFIHINSFISDIDFITNTSSTEWCSQPWPWTKSLEKVKRDESLDCECGLLRPQSGAQQGRVVGGVEATPYEFPWMILIYIFDPPDRITLCGGSIISDRVILTAAHCLADPTLLQNTSVGYDVIPPDRRFIMFSNVHSRVQEPKAIRIKSPLKSLVHPGYPDGFRRFKFHLTEHDIGLFVLDEPLNLTAKNSDGTFLHRPVCLPKYNEKVEFIGKDVTAAGWGSIHYDSAINDSIANELQKIELTAKPVEVCTNAQADDIYKKYYGRTTFCLSTDLMHSVNQGDSGGPIIMSNGEGKHYQVGAVSFQYTIPDRNGSPHTRTTHAADLQELLSFVDYYSSKYSAKYCKK